MSLIIDLSMHEKADLSREQFLNNVRCVKAIRSNLRRREEGLTLYIYSLETFMLFRHLRSAITQGDFDGLNGSYGCYHAAIEIADPLYRWLLNTDNDTALRQVTCWLAALYYFEPDSQSIMERQLYPPVFRELRQVAAEHFRSERDIDEFDFDAKRAIYHAAALSYYGSIPPLLLWKPVPLFSGGTEAAKWGVHDQFDISIKRFYFTHSDWESVIVKGEEDSLQRSESSEEYWEKIKHQYVVGARSKDRVFSLYTTEVERGQVYLIRAADTGYYKIGYTSGDPRKRLAQLQTGSPHELSLIGSFSCSGKRTEKLLHAFFAEARASGEWFRLSDAEAEGLLNEEWRAEHSFF